jgi:hypothetical protein
MVVVVPDWYAWASGGLMAIAIVAAIVVAARRPAALTSLPLQHIAAAAIIGVFGWEASINLPQQVLSFFSATAGIPEVSGIRNFQILVAAQIAFVAATLAAVVGILRRQPWGIALGIGVSAARVAMAAMGIVSTLSIIGDSADPQLAWFVVTAGLQGLPALAAIVLLAWPLVRGETGHAAAASTPDGIVELDPDLELGDWPDATARAEVGR